MAPANSVPQEVVDALTAHVLGSFTSSRQNDLVEQFSLAVDAPPYRSDLSVVREAFAGGAVGDRLFLALVVSQIYPPADGQLPVDYFQTVIANTNATGRFWDLLMRVSNVSAALAVLAKVSMAMLFPWVTRTDLDEARLAVFDVRRQAGFESLVLQGLRSPDPTDRKTALFLLKQTVKVSDRLRDSDLPAHPLVWGPENASSWHDAWCNFCLLYATVQESQAHLVRGVMPLLNQMLSKSALLSLTWWECIIQTALGNQSATIKRLVLRHVMAIDREQAVALQGSAPFLFGPLLAVLGNSFLYSTMDSVRVLSPFGDRVCAFYGRVFDSFADQRARGEAVRAFVRALAERLVAAVPLIYLIRPLLSAAPVDALGAEEFACLRSLAANRGLHNRKARRLFHWQLLQVMMAFTDCSSVPFQDIAELLAVLEEGANLAVGSDDYGSVSRWLCSKFSRDFLEASVRVAFGRAMSAEGNTVLLQSQALVVALMVKYMLGAEDGMYVRCAAPILQALALVSRESSTDHLVSLFAVVGRIEEALRPACSLVESVDVAARLLEYCDLIERALLSSATHCFNSPQMPYEHLRVLLEAFALFLGRGSDEVVVPYLDMLAMRMLGCLKAVFRALDAPSVATIGDQMLRMTVVSALHSCARRYVALRSTEQISRTLMSSLDMVVAVDLERPSEVADYQWTTWPELETAFRVDKYGLIGAVAHLHVLTGTPFNSRPYLLHCMATVGEAKYNGAIACIRCMRHLLACGFQGDLLPDIVARLTDAVGKRHEMSKWIKAYACAAIDLACSVPVMSVLKPELHGSPDGCVRGLLEYLVVFAESRYGYIVVHMAAAFGRLWRHLPAATRQWVFMEYASLLVALGLFGPVRMLPEDVIAQEMTLDANVACGDTFLQDDSMARVHVLDVFNQLDAVHDGLLISTCTSRIFDVLELGPKAVEALRKKSFENTLAHRVRLRAWMCLLVLLPGMSSDLFTGSVADRTLRVIGYEPLPSTRLFAEWLLIVGLVRHPPMIESFLLPALSSPALSAGTLISLLSIAVQVCRAVASDALGLRFLDAVTPWFCHNHATARMHVFWAYAAICDTLAERRLGPREAMTLALVSESAHGQKFVRQIGMEAAKRFFDARALHNMQGICSLVPAMTQRISADEGIPVEAFDVVGCRDGAVAIRSERVPAIPEKPLDEDEEQDAAEGAFYQQKTNPLETEMEELAIDREGVLARAKAGIQGKQQIVIIASLLDKIPNVAGLCRTAEILAADTLIIGDAAMLPTKDFQTVCMTSDRWVDIEEVQPLDLGPYLGQMRLHGYTIIAVEQSSNSVPLQSYAFPAQFCLLLGNEREGVRADLLHLCDVCLEIPQYGVIRSLNVHVAGSMVLWEARRQALVQGK